MFSMHSFVMSTILGMIGKEPEYKVRQYALGWLERDVLTQTDLAEIEDRYAELIAQAEVEAVAPTAEENAEEEPGEDQTEEA